MKYIVENDYIIGNLGFDPITISPSENKGYRPFELFVSSLVGCSGTILRNILTKRKYAFQKLEIEVSAVRNPDHANRIEQLSFTAYVQSDEPLTSQLEEKISDLVVKNCGMIQSVIQSIDITFTINSVPLNGVL
ncbi:putative redox protein [Bacillus sp. SLBN-46]|uniref:OsmC family protein n=1 Tax=Bacillus sp. SLBN-46 TaxID=3042283 RepID=UPI00285547F7|nr:OsmC family protein [Bacillus sp. SLBN-46]MDR6124838.1 putative redox protein [Bacillus sp. SLBN-46]